MLFHLVKKDLILAKKYLLVMLIFAVVAPIFFYSKLRFSNGSFASFLITVLFMEYILFNMVSMQEDKYGGSALLCTTPYTRNGVIKAKYLYVLVIFIGCFLLYNLATAIGSSIGLARLNTYSVGIALLIISVFFGILIPIQTKFGYEKTKYIFFILIFLTPFILPAIIEWYQSTNFNINFSLSLPQTVKVWMPFVISILIGLISMIISIRIFSKKNL
ncbi:ABC-2 transporter permease [Aneurinibacillus migulanus]|uniref:ABC transporter permease n=1 Tax=Aneurinibacillus migulanus TaxID=47500 RepID=A0A0D1VUL5_ANEMI|nr:ABC-2 transporter permease [Aneurinibacillus migulanus]KIV49975.1 ABC transporter permease [Aneurinibacillus migulanus]KON97772.1 ABC transporter permease [Aneurinibacillus migulanus]MED0894633.1 ABC-2 transporter permease [Aneurinibacillus migulanus]MED1619364.1 ABC-2 transporter permease [Aneurinibacillus migulanus]SDJ75168.1 ABC-2 family transporter protein [Aneurinibacillus migulanus]